MILIISDEMELKQRVIAMAISQRSGLLPKVIELFECMQRLHAHPCKVESEKSFLTDKHAVPAPVSAR